MTGFIIFSSTPPDPWTWSSLPYIARWSFPNYLNILCSCSQACILTCSFSLSFPLVSSIFQSLQTLIHFLKDRDTCRTCSRVKKVSPLFIIIFLSSSSSLYNWKKENLSSLSLSCYIADDDTHLPLISVCLLRMWVLLFRVSSHSLTGERSLSDYTPRW